MSTLFFFSACLRCTPKQELEKIYDGDVGDIFDIAEAKGALVRRRESLVAECKACHEVSGRTYKGVRCNQPVDNMLQKVFNGQL